MPSGTQKAPSGFVPKLEAATNIAVLIAAVLVAGYFAHVFLARADSPRPPGGPEPGTRLAAPAGHDWASHSRTFVLALRTDCSYCEESMPFYRRLVDTVAAHPSYGLIAAFPNPQPEVEQSLARHRLQIPIVAGASLGSLGVSATPTVLLVNSDGTVLRVWLGRLAPEHEQELLEAIKPSLTTGSVSQKGR